MHPNKSALGIGAPKKGKGTYEVDKNVLGTIGSEVNGMRIDGKIMIRLI